jgi:hypothetical protein
MARYFKSRDAIDAAGLVEIIAWKLALRGAGVPLSIVSDRGPQFTSKFWAAFCHHLSIERQLSTAYHPQTDGKTKRQNQSLEQYLRVHVNHLQDDWVHWLPLAKFAYNNSIHASTGLTPFYAEKAHHPELSECIREVQADCSVPDVPDTCARAQKVLEISAVLERRWNKATAIQRKYADRHTKPRDFAVSDMVWLSGNNIQMKRPCKMLDYRFYGPYPVAERIGRQAYRLKLSQQVGNIHNVFHVLLLEPYVSGKQRAAEPPPPIEVEGAAEYEVEEILRSGYRRGVFRYLVKWIGYSADKAERLPESRQEHAQDLVREFLESHPTQPKPPRSGLHS